MYSLKKSNAALPSAPTELQTTSVSSHSITLSWSLPTTDNSTNYTLSLTYRDTSNDEPGSHSMMEELNFTDQRRSQTITSLQPGARYRCCISAVYSVGSSSSTCINVTTTETGIVHV